MSRIEMCEPVRCGWQGGRGRWLAAAFGPGISGGKGRAREVGACATEFSRMYLSHAVIAQSRIAPSAGTN
jgi:hypothetical protein